MKKCAVLVLLILLLSGCTGQPDEMEIGLRLRSNLLQSKGCSFETKVSADYGDKIHTFSMNCTADTKGNLTFTVTEPDSISGICGNLTGAGGKLTFDETALHFDLMGDQQLSPISAPWILIKTLLSGYMVSACTEDGRIRLSVDDSYEDNPLRLDIWLNSENMPDYADILHNGRRILSVAVDHFEIM